MNNKNKDFFINDVEVNINEEDIVLAPPTELIEEAREISQSTGSDERFPFTLQYDPDQKEYLLSMLATVGATVKSDENNDRTLSTVMNMIQLAFIKRLDCVERVMTDEGINPFLSEGADKLPVNEVEQKENISTSESTAQLLRITDDGASDYLAVTLDAVAENDGIAVACVGGSSSSCCPTNTSMDTAAIISDESYTSGCICCPGAEQWFKFTATRTGRYTILTTGDLDTIGTLYDCYGNQIVRVDDYAPCGKINFRIIYDLTAEDTYYIKVGTYGGDTGSYTLRVTERVFADYVTISKNTIVLERDATYELPVTPNYVYKGYNGAQRIPGLSVSIHPTNAAEQKIWWWEQVGSILDCSYGWDNDGNRYIHVTGTAKGTAKLYAEDWNENGKKDECTVYVGGYPVTGITLNFTSKNMHIGENDYLWETITPSNALNRNVYWSSSNNSVAEVDSSGKVCAKSIGTAIITARTEEGGYTAQCTISVVEGVIVEKTDPSHNRIVFPNGKIWNCMNFDIINDYSLDQDDSESQRFYDNVYETKVYDEETDHTYYYEPFKEYTDEELKLIYMIDPHGMAAYVREYASALPNPGDGVQTMLSKILGYKDRIFRLLFNRNPDYYARTINGEWYVTSSRNDLTNLISESESLFGTHPIYDMVTFRQCLTVLVDIISMAIQCPALSRFKFIGDTLPKLLKYFSLTRSVSDSILSADFEGFLSAIIDGLIDEDELDETIVVSGKEFKAANYNMGWAFEMLSFSSDLGALADTFNSGPHFYKEVFAQCASETDYDVYLRTVDGNLVSVSNLANIID